MGLTSRCYGAALALTTLIGVSACENKPAVDTSRTEAKVSGTVKVRGTPMKGGEITFDPSNYQRKDVAPKSVPVKDDGTFELTTLVGKNAVRISGPAVKKDPKLGYETQMVDVTSGDNNVDLNFAK